MSLANVKPDIDVSYYIHSTHDLSLADVLDRHCDELNRVCNIAGSDKSITTLLNIIGQLKQHCTVYRVYVLNKSMFPQYYWLHIDVYNVNINVLTRAIDEYACVLNPMLVKIGKLVADGGEYDFDDEVMVIKYVNSAIRDIYLKCPNDATIERIVMSSLTYQTD